MPFNQSGDSAPQGCRLEIEFLITGFNPSNMDNMLLSISHPLGILLYCASVGNWTKICVSFHSGDLMAAVSLPELPIDNPDCAHPTLFAGSHSCVTSFNFQEPYGSGGA